MAGGSARTKTGGADGAEAGISDDGCSLAAVKTGVQPQPASQIEGRSEDSETVRAQFGSVCLMSG